MHVNGKTIGLIQLNDSRENRFTLEKIDKYQLLADHMGSIIWNLRELQEKAGHELTILPQVKENAKV